MTQAAGSRINRILFTKYSLGVARDLHNAVRPCWSPSLLQSYYIFSMLGAFFWLRVVLHTPWVELGVLAGRHSCSCRANPRRSSRISPYFFVCTINGGLRNTGSTRLKKNQNAPRPSAHPPVRGGKMSKRLGGIKGCKYKTSVWHLNGFPDVNNIGPTV